MQRIADYPAVLETVALSVPEDAAVREVELYTVPDLESIVDQGALLRGDVGVDPPYWALVWIGARAIAEHVAGLGDAFAGTAVDVGCGLGLSGIAAAKAGAEVTFTDYSDEALAFVEASARHNGLTGWTARNCDFTRDGLDKSFDWVLAADVVYEPDAYQPLVSFLDTHLADTGTLLLTETLRADAQRVVDGLIERGLQHEKQALWIEEYGKPERTWLHTFRRRS